MYKEEEDGETFGERSELTFTTKASSSLCGIAMDVGDEAEDNGHEYLLGLNRHESTNELGAALCGVFSDWGEVDLPLFQSCVSTPSPAQQVTKKTIGREG